MVVTSHFKLTVREVQDLSMFLSLLLSFNSRFSQVRNFRKTYFSKNLLHSGCMFLNVAKAFVMVKIKWHAERKQEEEEVALIIKT